MGVLRYFREILTNIKEENEISPLMIHSLTFGGNIVCFSADDKQYHAQYSAAQTAPSAYGYHPVEVTQQSFAVSLQIICRTPGTFIPGDDKGAYEHQQSEYHEEYTHSPNISLSQLCLGIDRIFFRIFFVESAVKPFECNVRNQT